MRTGAGLVVVLALGAGLAAGSQAGAVRGDEGPATVLAAASLTEVLTKIDPAARVSFAGSSQLAQQIRQGFPFDVYLSASPQHTRSLAAEGLVRKPVAFATSSVVLIVPRANPAGIRRVADLDRPARVRLVAAGPKVPIGLYTREVLKRLGLVRVLGKMVSLEPDVKGIVGKVALGEADAGFVYATDVRSVAAKVRVIRIPRSAQPTVVYEAAIATGPRDVEAAQAFLLTLLGPEGRRALRGAGFGLPE